MLLHSLNFSSWELAQAPRCPAFDTLLTLPFKGNVGVEWKNRILCPGKGFVLCTNAVIYPHNHTVTILYGSS